MNRRRLFLIGAAALLLAGVITFGFNRVLRIASRSGTAPTISVVVAATDLAVGSRLEANSVRLASLPASEVPVGIFRDVKDVVNRGVTVPIVKNEVLLSTKIATGNSGAGLSVVIPEGMRAVSVKVNDVVSVAGYVVPGTHVDVLLTGNPEKENDPGRTMTTTVLENVLVLAAGTKLEPDAKGEPQSVPVITLQVSPSDAQKLTLASTQGKIQLALRNPLDAKNAVPDTVLHKQLYRHAELEGASRPGRKSAVAKAYAPPPPVVAYVVEVIRGDKKDVAKF